MRKPPPSVKLYPAPRGFERVALDAYHVRARSQRGVAAVLKILSRGTIKFALEDVGHANEIFLEPGEAHALGVALIETAGYAAPLHVKPRVRITAGGGNG